MRILYRQGKTAKIPPWAMAELQAQEKETPEPGCAPCEEKTKKEMQPVPEPEVEDPTSEVQESE
jgi:hypothetical protein